VGTRVTVQARFAATARSRRASKTRPVSTCSEFVGVGLSPVWLPGSGPWPGGVWSHTVPLGVIHPVPLTCSSMLQGRSTGHVRIPPRGTITLLGARPTERQGLELHGNSCVLRRTPGRIMRPVTFRSGLDGQLAA
jgi:hypothetical protein